MLVIIKPIVDIPEKSRTLEWPEFNEEDAKRTSGCIIDLISGLFHYYNEEGTFKKEYYSILKKREEGEAISI